MSYNQPWYQQQWQAQQDASRFQHRMLDQRRQARHQHLEMILRGQEINRRAAATGHYPSAPTSVAGRVIGVVVWLAVVGSIIANA